MAKELNKDEAWGFFQFDAYPQLTIRFTADKFSNSVAFGRNRIVRVINTGLKHI